MTLDLDKSQWKRVALGEVAAASKEKVDPSEGTVDRFVAGEHMDTDDLKIHRWGDPTEIDLGPAFHRRFRVGQVLYGSRRTYLRKVAVADFEGVCANTTFVIETRDPAVLLQEFLPFVMSCEPFHEFAVAESKGSVNPYVNWSDIERYEFDLPPLDEQKRLADLLWAVERSVRTNAALSEGVTNACDTWLESVLCVGVTKHGWKQQLVPDLVLSGPTNGKSATANDEERGVPTLSISAIRNGRVLGGNAVKYIDVRPQDVSGFAIEPDDFLVVRGNGNKHLTGRGGLADASLPDGCVFPDLLIRLKFDDSVLLPKLAAAQWNSRTTHGALIRKAKSTNGIWKINGQDIKSHQLTVPPLEDQERILENLVAFDRANEATGAEAARLGVLRASIFSEIFGGN